MTNLKTRIIKVIIWILAILIGALLFILVHGFLTYPAEYVYRVLAWGNSDVFDWQKFPEHQLDASPVAYKFSESANDMVPTLLANLAEVEDWEEFLEDSSTQAFIVIQEGTILYEGYYNDTQRDSIVTSFSMAKSFTSALVGIAIDEGYIGSVEDPITNYLPELLSRDQRFENISIHDLLRMSSGLEYKEVRFPGLNSDDPLTTYFPDQRQLALENPEIIDPPGEYFSYNKYHPQLLGMILERTTGMTVTEYLQAKIWDPLGMEFGGSWSIDSEESDFEKMETGVNGRAIDFAKFGQLFLNEGRWNGKQVISSEWVAKSTQPFLPANYTDYYNEWFWGMPEQGYYNYMWWGVSIEPGVYDFAAEGDRGQFIYVSPRKSLVIVRHGINYGYSFDEWFDLFYRFVNEL